MSKSILRLLAITAITALVLPGCDDSGTGNADSAGMNAFLDRFSAETSGNGGGGECGGYTLTIRANPAAGGTVLPSGTHCYSAGTDVRVTVTSSNSGYWFTNWSGALTSEDTVATVTMYSNQTLTANFQSAPQVTASTFTDSRNQRTYRTIKIGKLRWMAENLNYVSSDSWCYGEGGRVYHYTDGTYRMISEIEVQANCAMYGRLYSWDAAMSACPLGWRLPDTADWNDLVRVAGHWSDVGHRLRSKTGWGEGWYDDEDGNWVDGNGTDDYGFSALPGGYRLGRDIGFADYPVGSFFIGGWGGYWWSATESESSSAYIRSMAGGNVEEWEFNKDNGNSIRCVMDN